LKIFVKVVKTGSRCYHKLYLQVPTHCLLLFAIKSVDLLDSFKIYTQEDFLYMENLRCEKAVEKKHNGYNCAQAVACSFCKEASMDEDTLKKITQGFGAGLGTMAGTCGAISGAAVVAGLINQDKAGTSQTVRSVMNQFKQQNGTVICKDLKGVETGKVIRSCDDCVRDAVKFLEDALKSGN
jgi:C_GCAxxG_C_C family probable redox protein